MINLPSRLFLRLPLMLCAEGYDSLRRLASNNDNGWGRAQQNWLGIVGKDVRRFVAACGDVTGVDGVVVVGMAVRVLANMAGSCSAEVIQLVVDDGVEMGLETVDEGIEMPVLGLTEDDRSTKEALVGVVDATAAAFNVTQFGHSSAAESHGFSSWMSEIETDKRFILERF
ncbi:unnamed protein product [Anisakis simplex]|uniref:Uncharacterized protein n=1 Tax=Anisakis simplex TaxID=6269 RepID=A0A0M3KFN2_ANISI|nr:unnamed protein product [Anisakis simplex]